MEHSRSRLEPIKSWELIRLCDASALIKEIRYSSIELEMGFAITFDKTQSQGFSNLILDQKRCSGKVSFNVCAI